MTIDELKILLDIDNPDDVLKSNTKECDNGWLFVDSNDGHCYLFDNTSKEKDINCLTKIDGHLFSKDAALTKIVVPSSVMSIWQEAFFDCISLTSVTIPNNVIDIGYGAFAGCSSLTSVTIPDSVMSIKDGTFMYCDDLTSVTIPNSVTSIGNYAFENCISLTSITIPNSVMNIKYRTFFSCSNLKSLVFKGKTLAKVKQMKNYPFGIEDESIIKCEA